MKQEASLNEPLAAKSNLKKVSISINRKSGQGNK